MPQGQGKRLPLKFICASYLLSNMLPNYLRPDYLQLDAKSCRNKAASTYFPLTAIIMAFSCPKVPVPTRQGGCQRVKHSSASAADTPQHCRELTIICFVGLRVARTFTRHWWAYFILGCAWTELLYGFKRHK